LLAGIEQADSIAFDAHKWLSVPMGAGMYLTRHVHILEQTFDMEASYMPREADHVDPYRHSLQWSRRFMGLKVLMSLAVAGWEGYAQALRHQTAVGEFLRTELTRYGWRVVNQTRLPLVCFVDGEHPDGGTLPYLEALARTVVASGDAWISTTRLGGGRPVLRACVTNYRTTEEDVVRLVRRLEVSAGRGR
jgi:glutamate/tyrosine decarboxylase-like PLP-dependent enzyme